MALVLVVEDNPTIRDSLADLFQSDGFDTAVAGDGADALAQLDGGLRPSVIVLDLMMPVMDGWQFLERKAIAPYADLPVVVLTALNFDGDVMSLRERHGCEVLPKTGSVDTLLSHVQRAARG